MFMDVKMKIVGTVFTDDLKNLSSDKSLQLRQLIFDNVSMDEGNHRKRITM